MPPSPEDGSDLSRRPSATLQSASTDPPVRSGARVDRDILQDVDSDRWEWRRKIRQNPRQLAVYRFAVGVAGLFLILAGLATGWLPGPGGIPLILLGLAVWSSEFQWAHRLMLRFKALLKRYLAWPRSRQVLFWVVFFLVCALAGYSYMLVLGVPGWLPNFVEVPLQRVPGL